VRVLTYLGHKPSSVRIDLRQIGGTKEAGRPKFHFNISKADSAILVTQSVTGILGKRINLKKLGDPDENSGEHEQQ
jgi:hypothetical protein